MMYKMSKNKETNKFEVYEEATERVVFSSKEHKESHNVYRRFSGGQGFAGWTPDFMFYGDYEFKC